VRMFADWLAGDLVMSSPELQARRDWILEHLGKLAGKDLCCWCAESSPCHADVLLAAAARAGNGMPFSQVGGLS
jgi:hypothetical protein